MRKMLRLPDVIEMTGKSRSSIYADPTFPRPIKIGTRSSAWLLEEIQEWLQWRIDARCSRSHG